MDRSGRIVWVNAAWRAFAARQGGAQARCGEGTDYLRVCRNADPATAPGAARAASLLEELLEGRADTFEFEYGWGVGAEELRFVMRGQSLTIDRRRCAFVQHENVTLARCAERQMRDSEGRYRQLFEAAPDAVFLIAAEGAEMGLILDANEVAARDHGYSRDELRGMQIRELDGAEDATRVAERISELLRDGEGTFEVLHRRRDGSEFPVEVTARIAHIDGRRVILSFNRDISERRRAAVELQTQSVRLELAARASEVGFWDWDLLSNRVIFSPEWKAQLGYAPDEISDHFSEWEQRCHPDDLAPTLQGVHAHLRREVPFTSSEFRLRHRDGSYRWIYSRGQAVFDASGVPVRMVGCHVDITANKAAQAERTAMASRIEQMQRIEAIGTLAGGIAHDFNNILTVITGNVDLALQVPEDPAMVREALGDVRRSAERAKALVRQILAFSRNDPPERRPTSVAELLQEAQRLLRATVPQVIDLAVQIDGDVPEVFVDAEQLQQVLLNLGVNAWHAIGERRGCIELRARAADLGGAPGAVIEVTDDGCGMDEATAQRVFEPFFTTKAGAHGTGLGLSVAHGIVMRHGGRIDVRSVRERGSTFSMWLPAAACRQPASTAGEPSSGRPRARVLLLDDEPALLRVMRRGLEGLGYRVTAFSTPKAALAAVQADPTAFDVVVTDYDMPGCQGLELARSVRTCRADLPVVLCSGFVKPHVLHDAQAHGIDRILNKPFVAQELGAVLEDVLRSAGG